ncbi:Hypothetical predicted protein [Octopus vulgaris]|uniref:Uncharacterized protein n=1 Tax=Octopus vulgaris TaxID=6645 RepID=A0AA36F5E6_OCTVU|nr:Hypothetical predicted protein [Octopus vulgaris]
MLSMTPFTCCASTELLQPVVEEQGFLQKGCCHSFMDSVSTLHTLAISTFINVETEAFLSTILTGRGSIQ